MSWIVVPLFLAATALIGVSFFVPDRLAPRFWVFAMGGLWLAGLLSVGTIVTGIGV